MTNKEKEVYAFLKKARLYEAEIDLIKKQIESLERIEFVDTKKHIEDLNSRIKKMQIARLLISQAISKFPNADSRMIYNCRYVLSLSWKQVGYETWMTSRNAKYIHDKSFPSFVKFFEEVMQNEGIEADYIVATISIGEKEN